MSLLETTASSLKNRNGLSAGRPLPLGRRVTLDFSRVGKADFEQRRLAHHRAIQQRFFSTYEVAGAVDYVRGANIGGFVKVADAMMSYGVL